MNFEATALVHKMSFLVRSTVVVMMNEACSKSMDAVAYINMAGKVGTFKS